MSFIFMLAFIALVTLLVFSLIGLVNPKKWQRLHKNKDVTRKDVFIGCIAGSVILIIVMVVTVPAPNKNTATVAQVQSENSTAVKVVNPTEQKQVSLIDQVKSYDRKSILSVEKQGENALDIHLKSNALGFSDGGYLDAAGRNAKSILIELIKNNSNEKFKIIRFIVNAELTDQYNNKSENAIFQIEYNFDEVKKINLSDGYVDYKMFLSFAKYEVRHPVGHSIFEDWCSDEGNRSQSGLFCSNH